MKRNLLKLVALALVCLLIDCSKKNSTEPVLVYDQQTYFPVRLGYNWKYDISTVYKDSTGKIDSVITFQHTEFTVVKDTVVAARRIVWVQEHVVADLSTGQFYIGNDCVAIVNVVLDPSLIYLQFPLAVGQTWDALNQTTMTVKSLTATVSVPAGEFKNCVLVQQTGRGITEHYYAPNVGRVRVITYGDTTSTYSRQTQIDFVSKNF